jgi:hypothetical protein
MKIFNLFLFLVVVHFQVKSQNNNVGIGTNTPAQSAILELSSTNQGLRLTRVPNTSAIANPVNGLLVFSESDLKLYYYNGTWRELVHTELDPQVSSTAPNTVPRWNGTTLIDGTIQDDGDNIGIGGVPFGGEKLRVIGQTTTTSLKISNGAGNGRILKSDAEGNANWVEPNSLPFLQAEIDPQVSSSAANTVPRWNGTTLIDGTIQDNGDNIGIGGVPSAGQKLRVVGQTTTTSLSISDGAGNGRVLQSDAGGNANWVEPNTLPFLQTETDPQVSITEIDRIPKWNGFSLGNGSIKDSLGQVIMNSLKTTSAKINSLSIPTGWVPNGILWSNSSDGSVQWRDFNTLEADPQVFCQSPTLIPKWNGTTLVDGSIRDFGSNGIGGIEVQGDIITQRLKMTENASTGKILVSENESGNVIWANIAAVEKDPKVNLIPADVARTIRWDGSKLQPGSMLDVGNGVQVTEIVPNSPTPIFNVTGLLSTTRFQIPTGAANNRVLKSDINGVGTWAPESDPKVNVLNNRRVARWNGTVLTDGVIQDDGQDVGIFTAPVFGQKLTVNGKTTTSFLQVQDGAQNGFVLTSDNMGNSSWTNPNTLPISETDPQVSASSVNAVPRWTGTTLANGVITDDNTNVAIGTNPVADQKLTVSGKTTTTNLQMTAEAGSNKIMRSDATGNATWVTPSSVEQDPQVSMTNTNNYPVWNGTTLVDAIMGQNGNEVIVEGNISSNTSTSANFRMTTGAGAGKILQSDVNGNAAWVNPLLVFSETDPKVATNVTNIVPRWNGSNLANGSIQDDGVNIGVGTAPVGNQKLTVAGTTTTSNLQVTTGAANGLLLRSDADGYGTWVTPQSVETDPQVSSAVAGRVPRWSGTALSDGTIQDDATNVGIGTAPVANQKLTVDGKTVTSNLQMTAGAANGRILQSDANGNGTWVNSTTLTVTETDPQVISSATGRVPRWSGTALSDGTIQDDATNVGIGTAPVANQKLTVSGKTTTTNLQMTTGAATGLVLQSDASGNGAWVNANTLIVAETDPQVTSSVTNSIPRWSGTALADGSIQDDAANVGIGTAPVANQKLTVNGKTTTTNLQMTTGAGSGLVLQSDASGNGAWVNSNTLTTNNLYNTNGTLTSARTITQGNNALSVANNGTQNTTFNLSSTGDFDIQDNGTSALKIQDDGFIGINQPTPLAGLHIKGVEASFDSHIRLETFGGGEYGNILYDGHMKFRNFGAGDEYQWRNSTNNIRMRLFDTGDLTVSGNTYVGGLTLNSNSISLTVDEQLIDVGGAGYFKLSSNSTISTNRTIILSDGLNAGQILFIESTSSATNAFEIIDGSLSNTNTSGTITMLTGDVIQLLWNGADWLQVSYSNN